MAKSTLFTDHETNALSPLFRQERLRFGHLCSPSFNPPVYLYSLLHPTILVVAGYCTVQSNLPFAAKLLLLVFACFASTWLIYHWISRPLGLPGPPFKQNVNSTKQNNGLASLRKSRKRKPAK